MSENIESEKSVESGDGENKSTQSYSLRKPIKTKKFKKNKKNIKKSVVKDKNETENEDNEDNEEEDEDDENNSVTGLELGSKSKIINHLYSYTTIKQLSDKAIETDVYQNIAEKSGPYINSAKEYSKPYIEKISPYIKTIDEFGEASLQKLDNTIPSVKEKIFSNENKTINNVKKVYEVKEDSKEQVKNYFERFTNLISNKISPYLKPINDKVEKISNNIFEKNSEDKNEAVKTYTSEFSRFFYILRCSIEKSIPCVMNKASFLSNLKQHVWSIYNKNSNKFENNPNNTVIPTYLYSSVATGVDLTGELVDITGKLVKRTTAIEKGETSN